MDRAGERDYNELSGPTESVRMQKRREFMQGMRDGVPIALGYFAVALTLSIYARGAGLTALAATLSSLLTHASAGQYATFSLIGRHAALAVGFIL